MSTATLNATIPARPCAALPAADAATVSTLEPLVTVILAALFLGNRSLPPNWPAAASFSPPWWSWPAAGSDRHPDCAHHAFNRTSSAS